MDSAELRKLLEYEEGAKLDFKIKLPEIYGAEKDKQWDELIKDVLSIANGNIGTNGEIGYLIIGAGDNLKPDGTRDLLDVGNVSLSRKQLLDKVNSACEPTIDIECKKVSLDGKTLLVISVPPSPYIYKLRRQSCSQKTNINYKSS